MGFSYDGSMYGDLWLACKSFWDKNLITAIPLSSPLSENLWISKNVVKPNETFNGKRVIKTIVAHKNDYAKFIERNDVLDSHTPNLLEAIEFDVKNLYNAYDLNEISISQIKSGEIVDIMYQHEQALRDGFTRKFSKTLYMHGRNDLEFNGLRYLISDNPYQTGLIICNLMRGGTPGDKFEFWRNRVGAVTGSEWMAFPDLPTTAQPVTKSDKLVDVFDAFLETMNYNGEYKVNAIYMNTYFYNLYKKWFRQRMQVNNVKEEKTDAGFSKLYYNDTPIYLDKYCPQDRIYFIHHKALYLYYLPGWDFKRDKRPSPNQYAETWRCCFVGNYAIDRPRTCGVFWVSQGGNFAYGVHPEADVAAIPNDCNLWNYSQFKDYDYDLSEYATDIVGAGEGDQLFERTNYSGSGIYKGPDGTGLPANGKARRK